MNIALSILFLGLGVWQFYITQKTYHQLKQAQNARSPLFLFLSLGFSLLFGAVMIFIGLHALIK